MKVCVRSNVFETNSSSMHSIAVSHREGKYTEEEIKESFKWYAKRNKDESAPLEIKFSNDWMKHNRDLDFGRAPFDLLYTYCDKLRYYIASQKYIWTDEDYANFIEELKELHPFIKSISFDKNSSYPKYDDTQYDYGSVDHESSSVLFNFLTEKGLSIEDFLKDKSYVIIVDGDEYGVTNHLLDAKIISLKEDPVNGGGFSYVE